MGLFDTVRCQYPLRNPAHQKLEFQTKDLECMLGEYTITRDGRLIAQPGRGLFGRRARRAVECPYHGDIRIYTSVEKPRRRGEWVEYLVRFTEGRVQRVRRIGSRLLPKARPMRLPRARLEPAGTKSQLPAPSLRGRFLTEEQLSAHAPHRLELIAGSISRDQKLARLLLINMGLNSADRRGVLPCEVLPRDGRALCAHGGSSEPAAERIRGVAVSVRPSLTGGPSAAALPCSAAGGVGDPGLLLVG